MLPGAPWASAAYSGAHTAAAGTPHLPFSTHLLIVVLPAGGRGPPGLGGQGRLFRPPSLPRVLLGTPDRRFCAHSAREARASAAGEPLLCPHPP